MISKTAKHQKILNTILYCLSAKRVWLWRTFSWQTRTVKWVIPSSKETTPISLFKVFSYNPKTKTAKLESVRSNKLLMRRYAVIQRARDADVFGILVGTLGVGTMLLDWSSSWSFTYTHCLASYLPLISRLRSLLARHHKKSYTITVGKLNPAKLGNFLEIECFVLVACPENSLVEAKVSDINIVVYHVRLNL